MNILNKSTQKNIKKLRFTLMHRPKLQYYFDLDCLIPLYHFHIFYLMYLQMV